MYLLKNVSEAFNHRSLGVSGKSWPLSLVRPEFKSHPRPSLCDFEKILSVSEPVSMSTTSLVSQCSCKSYGNGISAEL